MKMKKEKKDIIEKISKLLLLANDQEGTPEGESAKSFAARLMAKYRIKETEVDLETDSFCLDTYIFYKDRGNVPQWCGRLVSLFCYIFDTQSVFRNYPDYQEYEVIGTFSDVETVLYFLDVCNHHIEKACWKTWPSERNWRKRQQTGNEAVSILWDRAMELKQQMDSTINEDESCTSLVVQKQDEIKKSLNELYPKLGKPRSEKLDLATDSKSKEAGINAGRTCPLNFAIEED
jgi:hypothetical protein